MHKKSQDYSVLSLTPSLVALAFFGLKGYDREMEELYGLGGGKEEIGGLVLERTVAAQERMDPKRSQKGTCEGETRQKQTEDVRGSAKSGHDLHGKRVMR